MSQLKAELIHVQILSISLYILYFNWTILLGSAYHRDQKLELLVETQHYFLNFDGAELRLCLTILWSHSLNSYYKVPWVESKGIAKNPNNFQRLKNSKNRYQ